MSCDRIAKQDDVLPLNLEEQLPTVQLATTSNVECLDGDARAQDCSPSKCGVVSVVPSPRNSSVVLPMVRTILPPSGTDNEY